MFKPTALLVTGGCGFIGAHFLNYCRIHFPSTLIVNLDNLTYAGANHHPTVRFVKGDICDFDTVFQLLADYQINSIVNFAAETHVDRSIKTPLLFAQSNVLGVVTLLEAAREYWINHKAMPACRFYQISTDEVFGSLEAHDLPFSETHRYQPRSPYSASKAAADHFVLSYYHTYGLPVILSHCGNNYGPMQHNEKLIPTVILACLNQSPIPVYGDGSHIRDWIYVEDHCAAIGRLLQSGVTGESYNVGAHSERSNIALVNEICALMDEIHPAKKPYASLIRYVTDRPGHDWRYALDTGKITTELQWSAHTSFKAGLRKTITYYLSQFERVESHDT
jgi:dTDP-glucose 4,6-dehydratase